MAIIYPVVYKKTFYSTYFKKNYTLSVVHIGSSVFHRGGSMAVLSHSSEVVGKFLDYNYLTNWSTGYASDLFKLDPLYDSLEDLFDYHFLLFNNSYFDYFSEEKTIEAIFVHSDIVISSVVYPNTVHEGEFYTVVAYDAVVNDYFINVSFDKCCQDLDYSPIVRLLGGQ